MSNARNVQQLLAEAAKAPTLDEAKRLVGEAESLRSAQRQEHAASREVDLGNAIAHDVLTPVLVHEAHSPATDWLGEIDTSPDAAEMGNQILAQATLWYGKVDPAVKQHPEEFDQQAYGLARKLAGAYGSLAEHAEHLFCEHVASLHDREVRSGAIKLAAVQEGQPGPNGTFPTGNYGDALPGEATTSERAPAIQALEQNSGQGGSQDVVPVNDPGLGQAGSTGPVGDQMAADGTQRAASRSDSKGEHMQKVATCPTCAGHGRVAYSGLPQIDQTVDPSDTKPEPTPLPPEVAFPWVMNPNDVGKTIQEAEQQIAERDKRRGASLHEAAQKAAQEVYQRVLAGYDASGWAGDMGQTPPGPGQQDGGNPPSTNLGEPDPVYGYGGDQGDKPVKPYGADEADDYTNNPGMNYQPGQPTQYDMGGRQQSTEGPSAPGFPNPPKTSAKDPEIAKAERFIEQRKSFLAKRNGR